MCSGPLGKHPHGDVENMQICPHTASQLRNRDENAFIRFEFPVMLCWTQTRPSITTHSQGTVLNCISPYCSSRVVLWCCVGAASVAPPRGCRFTLGSDDGCFPPLCSRIITLAKGYLAHMRVCSLHLELAT